MPSSQEIRMTPGRRAIMSVLEGRRWHPTAEEILHEVRREIPGMGLATVYRNLELFVDRGLVRVVEDGRGQRRFDAITGRHYHLRCVLCGKIEDTDLSEQKWLEEKAAETSGLEIRDHVLMFIGVCSDCTRTRGDRASRRTTRKGG